MPNDKTDKLLNGAIGFFWINHSKPKKLNRKMERGYVRLGDRGLIEVVTLDEEAKASFGGVEPPKSITGITEHGGFLLLTVAGAGSTMTSVPRASVLRYRGRTLISEVNPEKLDSDRLFALTLYLPSIGRWSGMQASNEEFGNDEDGLLKTYSVELAAPDDQVVRVGRGFEIVISSHWEVNGPFDKRVLYTPTAITCRSRRPRPADDLRERLSWLHALLCLAYSGFLTAEGGSAKPDCVRDGADPGWWDTRFMFRPPGVRGPSEYDFPLFTLATIGGSQSLARWMRLCEKHPRAVRPIVEEHLRGGLSPTVRLLEVAAGIEYWVNSHARSAAWAKGKSEKSLLLAKHIGATFGSWVGDTELWSNRFWETYNLLKHEPAFNPDMRTTAILAESGALLLTAAVLNRVAGTKEPARVMFGQAYNTWRLRDEVRKLVASSVSRTGRRKARRNR